jgi:hypothetical protein
MFVCCRKVLRLIVILLQNYDMSVAVQRVSKQNQVLTHGTTCACCCMMILNITLFHQAQVAPQAQL